MATNTVQTQLAVVGAGVIGLSCAWRAGRAGRRVTVVDPAPGSGASWVAGGMLAPVTEAWPGEEPLLELGCASLAGWPGFAAELAADAGASAGLRTDGTVVVATGSGDRAELNQLAGFLGRLGRDVELVSARQLRRMEPSIGPDVRGGLSVPGDLAVDNRVLLRALRAACQRVGVVFVTAAARTVGAGRVRLAGAGGQVGGFAAAGQVGGFAGRFAAGGPAGGVVADDGFAGGVVADDGFAGEVVAGEVLVAAGAYSSGLHPALEGLIRPVKGEILRLRRRPGSVPPPGRTVRAVVDGRHVYLVPRDDGGLVVGATQYETGFDTQVTVGGVRELLRDAERVLPGLAEYALEECSAGLRPGSPDNLPLIGRIAPGVLVATGHGRNGVLLAPVTADAVLALLVGGTAPEFAAVADPARLTGNEVACGSSR